jgi:hypothetical protein
MDWRSVWTQALGIGTVSTGRQGVRIEKEQLSRDSWTFSSLCSDLEWKSSRLLILHCVVPILSASKYSTFNDWTCVLSKDVFDRSVGEFTNDLDVQNDCREMCRVLRKKQRRDAATGHTENPSTGHLPTVSETVTMTACASLSQGAVDA